MSFGVEGLAGFEHFADDAEKPVDDAAQGPGMVVAALPERAVFGLAGGVPLDRGIAQWWAAFASWVFAASLRRTRISRRIAS